MRLLLMRHDLAAERETWAGTDTARPLTPEGKIKTKEVARGLRKLETRIDFIATSPLLRARQTAEIVNENYNLSVEHWPELENAVWKELILRLACLKNHLAEDTVALLVGHEPGLSQFAAHLLTGRRYNGLFEMKKAAVGAFDVTEFHEAGATLSWLMSPRALRLLGTGGA